ncbi:hypothetical protein BEN47_00295 [Hymenobacter lapidarius]|uniref:Uncharacterized protein n=1 Tax=Hymenobacter lapidarius TaxID=1908237 RepID=A0A1G1T9U9_9BACT|nr:hypothetical protein BEN47_00295 [Hymenobacter lapidarius]
MLVLGLSLWLAGCDARSEQKPERHTPAADRALQSVLPHFNQQWGLQKLWEDGLAEVATYEAERTVYQKKRTFELTQITVKEEFNPQFNVKTDDYQREGLFSVMKINQFCNIPTDQYPYHYLTSLFFRLEQPVSLFKTMTSSQEWCGTTFKTIVDDGVNFEQAYNSYWDNQGVGSRSLRRDVLLEDALPYTLRSLWFEQLPTIELVVLDLQQTNKVTPVKYYQARLTTAEARAGDVAESAWRVALLLEAGKENVYWFAKKYPNILLRQTTWDGRSLRLKSARRYAYWPR